MTEQEIISEMGWDWYNTESSARRVAEYCSRNMYSEKDMQEYADWCRNGLLNTEYSVDRLDKHLEQWKQIKKK